MAESNHRDDGDSDRHHNRDADWAPGGEVTMPLVDKEITHHSECWREHHACCVAEVERLQAELSQAELAAHVHSKALDEQAATIAQLRAKLQQTAQQLHDEQVRRAEWEKMYNQSVVVGHADSGEE